MNISPKANVEPRKPRQQQHRMITPMMMSTVLLLDLSGSEIKVELGCEWSFIGYWTTCRVRT